MTDMIIITAITMVTILIGFIVYQVLEYKASELKLDSADKKLQRLEWILDGQVNILDSQVNILDSQVNHLSQTRKDFDKLKTELESEQNYVKHIGEAVDELTEELKYLGRKLRNADTEESKKYRRTYIPSYRRLRSKQRRNQTISQ